MDSDIETKTPAPDTDCFCNRGHKMECFNEIPPSYLEQGAENINCDKCTQKISVADWFNHCYLCSFDLCQNCVDSNSAREVDVNSDLSERNDVIIVPMDPRSEQARLANNLTGLRALIMGIKLYLFYKTFSTYSKIPCDITQEECFAYGTKDIYGNTIKWPTTEEELTKLQQSVTNTTDQANVEFYGNTHIDKRVFQFKIGQENFDQ